MRLRREAAVGAGHAAQQAVARFDDAGIGGLRTGAAIERGLVDGIEIGLVARQAGEVEVVAKLATHDRMIEGVVVVEHRMDNRNLFLYVRRREAVIIHRADVEIAAVALAGEIDLREARIGGAPERVDIVVGGQTRIVVCQERLVGQHHPVPAPDPFVVERKLAVALHAAAEIAVAGCGDARRGVGKIGAVLLVDAGGADRVGAVEQALTKLALQQRPLLGGDHRRERGVIVRRQRPVVGNFNRLSVNGA